MSETHIFKSNIITFHLVSITWCSEFSDYQVLIWEAHFYFYIHKEVQPEGLCLRRTFLKYEIVSSCVSITRCSEFSES